MKQKIIVWSSAVLMVLTLACATNPLVVKQQAVAALQTGETLLHDARVAELALFTAGGDTLIQHRNFLDALDAAQSAEIAAAKALQSWHAGAGWPTDGRSYLAAAQTLAGTLATLTGQPEALRKVNAILANAQAVAKLLGGIQ